MVINGEQVNEELLDEITSTANKKEQSKYALPTDYVSKSSEQMLHIINNTVSKPTKPVHNYHFDQDLTNFPEGSTNKSTSLVKRPSSKVRLNHPSTNILGSLN